MSFPPASNLPLELCQDEIVSGKSSRARKGIQEQKGYDFAAPAESLMASEFSFSCDPRALFFH